MAQERIEKKPGICSRLKTAFRSKKAKQSELTPSLPTNVNNSPENTTLQIDRNQRLETTTTSNNQSKSGSNPNEHAEEEEISVELWSDAYENMRHAQEQLVVTYEKVLTILATDESKADVDPNEFETCDRKTRIETMRTTVDKIIKRTEKHSKARGYVIQGASILGEMKETINSALTSYPPAALAFSGLCATLPYLVKPAQQTKAVTEGLSQILRSLKWYMALSPLLLKEFHGKDDLARLREEMKDGVVELYQSLLEYQMKCTIRYFYTKRIVRVAKAIIGLEDWDGKFQEIEELDEKVKAKMKSYNEEAMKFLQGESNKDQKDMVGELRQMNRQRQQEKTALFNGSHKTYMELNNPRPIKDTCQWFLKHQSYEDWIENDPNLLIVSADTGCGKSVLSRHLVEDVLPREFGDWFICHFFFKNEGNRRNLSTGLSCIIHQLLSQTESLSETAQKKINEAGKEGLKDWLTLWDILLLLLKETENVIILLDAVDEMDTENFKVWMTKLKEGSTLNSTLGSNIKVLVTTRPYTNILEDLCSIQPDCFRVHGEDDSVVRSIQEDIKEVVRDRLDKLRKAYDLPDDTTKALKASFEQKGKDQKTYLWVKLAFELLESDQEGLKEPDHWTKLLKTISKGHIEAYEELLKRVPTKDKDDVRTVLSIVISAVSPPTAAQLDIALAVRKKFLSDPGAQNIDEKKLELRGERMRDWIRNKCRCFVTVYESQVHFVHETAKEFLLRNPSSGEQPANFSWHRSMTLEQCNATISECWISYVCIIRYPDSLNHLDSMWDFVKYGLFHFRACQVFKQITNSSNETSTLEVSDVSKTFQTNYQALLGKPVRKSSSWLWAMYLCCFPSTSAYDWQIFEAQKFPIFNMLLAAFFGHYNALVHLVTTSGEIDCADKEKVISAATMGGNPKCLQYLLSQKYPANASFKMTEQMAKDLIIVPGAFGENTALHWAAIWGNREMAQALIVNGADRNAHNSEGCKPITYTIRGSWTSRYTTHLRYLGRMSPSQEVRADEISIPSGCNESVWENSLMKIFVEKDADLEDALLNRSLLYEAVELDDENAVEFLLDYCHVEPDKGLSMSDDHYTSTETPLHLALEKGFRPICLRLLKARADASILRSKYIRAWELVEQIFLENVSALYIFGERGIWDEELLIALLKSRGKDVVNAKVTTHLEHIESDNCRLFAFAEEEEWNGATCLHRLQSYTSSDDHFYASFTKMLVDEGANINEPNANGKTILHIACEHENLPMATMLLGLGADPTLKDLRSRTPLSIIQDTHNLDHVPNDRTEFLKLCEACSYKFGPNISESINVE